MGLGEQSRSEDNAVKIEKQVPYVPFMTDDDGNPVDLNEAYRKTRDQLGWPHTRIARYCGVKVWVAKRWATKGKVPTEALVKLSKALSAVEAQKFFIRATHVFPVQKKKQRGQTRLTSEQVAAMRRAYAAGASGPSCALMANVSLEGAMQAIKGKTWAKMTDPPPVPWRQPPYFAPKAEEMILQIPPGCS